MLFGLRRGGLWHRFEGGFEATLRSTHSIHDVWVQACMELEHFEVEGLRVEYVGLEAVGLKT